MFKFRNIALSLLLPLLMAGGAFAHSPIVAADSNTCSASVVGSYNSANQTGSRFQINSAGTQGSVTVNLSGAANCQETITLVSWQAPNGTFDGQNVSSQTLYDSTTETLGVGTHTLTVPMLNCYYQLDLVTGSSPYGANGTAWYGNNLFGYAQGGSQACVQPACLNLTVVPGDLAADVSDFGQSATDGATFNGASINWGDGSTTTETANIVNQVHNYGSYGQYTITATAYFTLPGQSNQITATSQACTQKVSFTAPIVPTTPVTPTTPTTPATPATPATPVVTTLVNTGPGDVLAIVGLAVVLGGVAHNLLMRRLARR